MPRFRASVAPLLAIVLAVFVLAPCLAGVELSMGSMACCESDRTDCQAGTSIRDCRDTTARQILPTPGRSDDGAAAPVPLGLPFAAPYEATVPIVETILFRSRTRLSSTGEPRYLLHAALLL